METIRTIDSFYLIVIVATGVAWLMLSARPKPLFKLPRITPLFLILLLAFLLRASQMDDSFWYDETFSAAVAGIQWSDFAPAIIADVHPPLYYWILWHVDNLLGSSEWALRLPALIAGVASVWMMYHFSYTLSRNRKAALIAALILAVLPMHIRYSVEARGYSLLTLAVMSALFANLRGKSVLFVASVAILPLVHNHGYLYAAMLGLGALAIHKWRWLPVTLLSAVPGTVWLPGLISQMKTVSDGFWMIPFDAVGVITPFYAMSVGQGYNLPIDMLIVGGLTGITLTGLRYFRTNEATATAWALVAVGVPAGAAIMSWLWTPVYLHRALLPAVMLFVPVWAVGVWRSDVGRWALVTVLFLALAGYLTVNDRRNDDVRQWMDCRGDLIYTLSTSMGIQALYYSDGRDVYISPTSNDRTQRLPDDVKLAMGLIISDWHELPEGITVCVPHQLGVYTNVHRGLLVDILLNPHRAELKFDNVHVQTYAYEVQK